MTSDAKFGGKTISHAVTAEGGEEGEMKCHKDRRPDFEIIRIVDTRRKDLRLQHERPDADNADAADAGYADAATDDDDSADAVDDVDARFNRKTS